MHSSYSSTTVFVIMEPTSPPWAMYWLNPSFTISLFKMREQTTMVMSLLVEILVRPYPGTDGTMRWYGRDTGSEAYCFCTLVRMGRNSRNEPDAVSTACAQGIHP